MKLYTSLTSPFARKVRVALIEKHLDCPLELADPWANDPALLAANPLLQVPALRTDDGQLITNSDTITAWLERMYPTPALWPTETAARTRSEALAALAHGIIEYAVFVVLERRRPAAEQSASMIARRTQGILRTVAALETRFAAPRDRFHLDAIGIACALAYLDFRHPTIPWRESAPQLADWLAWAGQRESMRATAPPAA